MYTFLLDFDGTITLEDTTDGLFDRFADPSWRELDAAWARAIHPPSTPNSMGVFT